MDDHDENVDGGAPPLILPSILEFYSRLLGYVVVLGILYLMATRCAAAVEDTAPKERPVLRPGLMVDEDEGDNGDEETDDEDEGHVVEEIDTDEMIKGDGTRNRKAKKAAAPAAQSGPFPKELNPLTYKQPENEKVSFRDLHNAMLNRYKVRTILVAIHRPSLAHSCRPLYPTQDKYPNHGPTVASPSAADEYDEDMKALLREHLGK
ncbi:hypothetical protein AaE_005794 [Aphanomyces astaci]|uniref:Uncharacterized protein n=1 Tax=Aphanomyces astaci TaxID=112090 RepID=A0A6A5AF54_APHAT|nr:hypothetical protein AaE_005794 [Aphanomyces astaci]